MADGDNKYVEAREWLEAHSAGAFAAVIDRALSACGVVHCAADCFLAGEPCVDDPACLHIIFQCSELPALRRVLLSLPYTHVEWRRDFGHSARYGTRKRAITDFCRHADFGDERVRRCLRNGF